MAFKEFTAQIAARRATTLGRNGAGKSTLLRMLFTQLMSTSGRAYVNGYGVVSGARKARELICGVPQGAQTMGWQALTSKFLYTRGKRLFLCRGFCGCEESSQGS
ncbi:MAG: ATP-binding cassette domain-containing protein [Thermoprotei archaeon]